MGLIINDKIQMFMRGYPTVSDKYNVAGAVLAGTEPAQFGDMVKKSATDGYFEVISATNTIADVTEIMGIVVATNVKLATDWPGTTVKTLPGEAFNLLVSGFIAVELATGVKPAEITPNAAVYATASGGFTTATGTGKLAAIPNAVFTGMYENHGSTDSPKYFAEIYIK